MKNDLTTPCLEVENLAFAYRRTPVLQDLNMQIEPGELVVLTGDNGSGKSTFLKLVLGELLPGTGTIRLLGQDTMTRATYERIGYVPQVQNYDGMAFPITCLEMVVLNLYRKFGPVKIPRACDKKQAMEVLDRLGIAEYAHVPFKELSGGLQQRTLIARAMLQEPEFLILDEPTAGVDAESKESFLNFILDLHRIHKVTVLMVTHETELIRRYWKDCRIYHMERGQIHHAAV